MLEFTELLALAVAVAVSPMPIAGVLLLLGGPSGPRAALALGAGWTGSLLLGTAAVTLVAWLLPGAELPDDDTPFGLVPLLVGLGLIVLGMLRWPRAAAHASPESGWAKQFSDTTPRRALLLGTAFGLLRPKNVAVLLAAGILIGRAHHSLGVTAGEILVFAAIGSVGMLAPLAVFGLGGARVRGGIRLARAWTMRHLPRIAAAVLVALGFALTVIGAVRL